MGEIIIINKIKEMYKLVIDTFWRTPKSIATSRINAGILPIELAIIKRTPLIVVKDAPPVTRPEGTNGRILNRIININTFVGELFFIALKKELSVIQRTFLLL